MSAAQISPEPTEEEAAAIVAAIECGLPQGAAAADVDRVSRWRWSGRWWSKPVPVRRGRPG
ncbi:MAG TPA: hypothetical protein PLS63_06610 [Microthrixaceae bacterium]|jgi:hypothetical protein|nr:hypothetical protein [Microthrixaceae bacterium]